MGPASSPYRSRIRATRPRSISLYPPPKNALRAYSSRYRATNSGNSRSRSGKNTFLRRRHQEQRRAAEP